MRRRHLLAVTAIAFVASGIACVDLFHSTDFETLCTHSPNDPECVADGAATADVVNEPVVDAPRPRPNFCGWSSAEARKQALRACAWLGACEGPLRESSFGKCVVRAQLAYDCKANKTLRPAGETDELWSCLSTAQTCAEVDQCVFPKGVDACGTIDGGPGASFTASGNQNPAVCVRCVQPGGGRAAGVEPCAMLGQKCARQDEAAAYCSGTRGFNKCSTTTCAGTSAVDCNLDHDVGVDCAASGGTCVLDDAGAGPICAPNAAAPTCLTDAPPTCESTAVTQCVGGKLIRVDCGPLGLACDVTDVKPYDPTAACTLERAAEVECDKSALDECNGTTLTGCGRGKKFTIDCPTINLGGCTTSNKSGLAACAAPP